MRIGFIWRDRHFRCPMSFGEKVWNSIDSLNRTYSVYMFGALNSGPEKSTSIDKCFNCNRNLNSNFSGWRYLDQTTCANNKYQINILKLDWCYLCDMDPINSNSRNYFWDICIYFKQTKIRMEHANLLMENNLLLNVNNNLLSGLIFSFGHWQCRFGICIQASPPFVLCSNCFCIPIKFR